MLSLEAERRHWEGFDRALQKRVNGFPAFGEIHGPIRHRAAPANAVEDADADLARHQQQRRDLLGFELGVVPALHHVRPLATPLDEAQLASRQLLEAVGENDEDAARKDVNPDLHGQAKDVEEKRANDDPETTGA